MEAAKTFTTDNFKIENPDKIHPEMKEVLFKMAINLFQAGQRGWDKARTIEFTKFLGLDDRLGIIEQIDNEI